MKKPLWILTTLILLTSAFLKAEDKIYIHPKSDEISEFVIENTSLETQEFWVLVYQNEFVDETHFEITADSKMKVQLQNIKLENQDFAVLIKSDALKLSNEFQNETSTLFEKAVQPLQRIEISPINLWVTEQNIKVDFLDTNNNVIESQTIKSSSYLKSKSFEMTTPAGSYKIRVQGSQKIAFSPQNQMKALMDQSRKPANSNESVAYFLVENDKHSSFVAPIKNPELIQRAREEITNYQGFMIFAEIDFNETDINRNHLSPIKPYWNWKITEVTGLAQIGAVWCQAYPEMIERMLFQLVNQKRVCFIGQRIVRELKENEL